MLIQFKKSLHSVRVAEILSDFFSYWPNLEKSSMKKYWPFTNSNGNPVSSSD